MNWFKEVKKRWTSKTPIFWKKILSVAITLGTSAVAVITSERIFDLRGYGVPNIVFTIAGYVIVICASIGLMAQITVQDPNIRGGRGPHRRYSNNYDHDYEEELDA